LIAAIDWAVYFAIISGLLHDFLILTSSLIAADRRWHTILFSVWIVDQITFDIPCKTFGFFDGRISNGRGTGDEMRTAEFFAHTPVFANQHENFNIETFLDIQCGQ
jgi:hypothetical protein